MFFGISMNYKNIFALAVLLLFVSVSSGCFAIGKDPSAADTPENCPAPSTEDWEAGEGKEPGKDAEQSAEPKAVDKKADGKKPEDAKTPAKPEDKKAEETKPVAKPAPEVSKAPAAATGDKVHEQLDKFAYNIICSINKCVLPSEGKKEVLKNADGTFTARYLSVDPSSISTSYKVTDNKAVKYIGYMRYVETEYRCTAATKKEAEKGPFVAQSRNSMTELVKYVKGKWTY